MQIRLTIVCGARHCHVVVVIVHRRVELLQHSHQPAVVENVVQGIRLCSLWKMQALCPPVRRMGFVVSVLRMRRLMRIVERSRKPFPESLNMIFTDRCAAGE